MAHTAAGRSTVLSRSGALLLLGVLAQPVHGQQSAVARPAEPRLQGVVAVEESMQLVPGATIEVLDTDVSTRSGPLGQFEVPDAPLGTVWVRVSAPGYPAMRQEVTVSEEGVVFVQFLLRPVSTVLSELLVQVGPPPEGIEAQARTAWDLLAIKVPSVSGWTSGNVGKNDVAVRLRGFSTLSQSTEPILLVDDVLVASDQVMDALSQIPAQDVESIDVFRGPSASIQYPFAANGVISVRTRN